MLVFKATLAKYGHPGKVQNVELHITQTSYNKCEFLCLPVDIQQEAW